MAFNLTTCPSGWVPADGTNGTVDLRGVFVRGMESFNGGATASTTADPDRAGSATLGSYQSDTFQSHVHDYNPVDLKPWGGIISVAPNGYLQNTNAIQNTTAPSSGNTSTETRPKNRALLYCQKT
jgi:hypothetical protein